jgi:hypothetical protein
MRRMSFFLPDATVDAALSRLARPDHRFQGKNAGYDATQGATVDATETGESHELRYINMM